MTKNHGNKSVGRMVSTVHRYGYMHLSKTFDQFGLGRGQVKFLMALFEQNDQTQEQIATVLKMDKTTTARAVRKLEDEGYVTRRPHPTDRRSQIVSLTEKAFEMEPLIRSILEEWTTALTKDFTEEEKELALNLLRRMADNAVKQIQKKEG
ncbi:MarR family winged helix-turn-helix transcriptional regulator [Jeotgalibacillus proteolyticus]|uniref:MarR family transcriptional regulator n=1 Tax=Jeotgalibacillus proteolyticus TaxID=2082395 RepID=A0A2S5GA01_9BACL|nr:MarR family transcriptional regulator [Jeotgalibacillus proteolyticus]PPA69743.1 MarR family transcriptional regulator [Jeotgalibacillus proteolyticus]